MRIKSKGFTRINNEILRDPILNIQEKGFYSYLSSYANNHTDEVLIGVKKMADENNLSVSTVKRLLVSLEKQGYIKRIKSNPSYKTILLK